LLILIPLDQDDLEEASLSTLNDVKFWALIEFEEGRVLNQSLFQNYDEINEMIDVVIVKSSTEYIWPFMEKNIAVLVAHTQKSVEDILEAVLFKELHEAH
jgi:hypothetical protein